MNKVTIVTDDNGEKVVLIPEIIFKNRQNIDWKSVEKYASHFVDRDIYIECTNDKVYVGNSFPDEYANSNYTRKLKGSIAKAKANAIQGISEMINISINKTFRDNLKVKKYINADCGWYYYNTRFALPIYNDNVKTNEYCIYSGRIVINCSKSGRLFLYDIVDIKKEARNPLKTT